MRASSDTVTGGSCTRATLGHTRPRLVLTVAHRREFDVLLFWSLDRLSREGTRETLKYLTTLEGYGVEY